MYRDPTGNQKEHFKLLACTKQGPALICALCFPAASHTDKLHYCVYMELIRLTILISNDQEHISHNKLILLGSLSARLSSLIEMKTCRLAQHLETNRVNPSSPSEVYFHCLLYCCYYSYLHFIFAFICLFAFICFLCHLCPPYAKDSLLYHVLH